IVIGLALRTRAPRNRPFQYLVVSLYFGWFGACAYFFGSHSSMFGGVVLLGGVAVALVLFDNTVTLIGIILFSTIMLVTTVGSAFHVLPYAPFLREAPFGHGTIALSWLASFGLVEVLVLFLVIAILYFAVNQWRQHEERLERANDLISRYVAAQVSEQILAGNYHVVDHHERRRLTLVFSDVKDFTAISDQMEPEDLSRMLNRYFSEMVAIAERYGGTIDKFIGDAMMVFFGAPTSTDDHDQALRAVRMAVEMQAALEG